MRWLVCLLAALLLAPRFADGAPRTHAAPRQHAVAAPVLPTPTKPAPAPLATPRLTLQLQPADLTIDAGSGGDLVLTAHNPGSTPIAQADLSLVVPDGVHTSVKSANPASGLGDLVWTIHVDASSPAPDAYKLLAELRYAATGSPLNTDMAVAAISQTAPPDLASSLKTTIAPSEGSLDQFNALALSVQIQNPDRRPAAISGFTVLSPPYVVLASAEDKVIPPGATGTLRLNLKTADKVIPGPYTLVLQYLVKPGQNPEVKPGQNPEVKPGQSPEVKPAQSPEVGEYVTVQGKVTVGVPGVSDVMQLLGVSSFLLLPGALTVVAFFAVFARFTATKELDWKSPTLILIAVTLSFCYAVAYPFAVALVWPAQKPNYLRGYDLFDAFWLWIGSVGAGAVAAVAAALLAAPLARWQNRWEPNTNDKPIDVLRKLAHRDASFTLYRLLQRPAAGVAPNPDAWLALPFGKCAEGQRWVVKQATIATTAARRAAILAILAEAPGTPDRTGRLYRAIVQGRDAHDLTVRWEGDISPRTVAYDDYPQDGVNQDRIVTF